MNRDHLIQPEPDELKRERSSGRRDGGDDRGAKGMLLQSQPTFLSSSNSAVSNKASVCSKSDRGDEGTDAADGEDRSMEHRKNLHFIPEVKKIDSFFAP